MRTIKFHKSECGVEIFLNVLFGDAIKQKFLNSEVHNTDYFEIVFFKQAKGFVILNQKIINLEDNNVIFISPYQKRNWILSNDKLDFTTLIFHESFLNDFFSDKLFSYKLLYFYQLDYPLNLKLSKVFINKICDMLQEIKNELVNYKTDSSHIIRSLLYYLLQKLNREYADINKLTITDYENNYAYQFKHLLESNIKQQHTVDFYAEKLKISRITINKSVKKQFHVTASHLLRQRLLFEIKNYIIYSGLTIREISSELNFSEPNHMSRFFKSQTGKTMSEFINDYQNGIY